MGNYESYQEALKIQEELKQKEFENWARGVLPYYDSVSVEELKTLRALYETAKSWQEVVNRTLSMALNFNTTDIDYANDYEKNNAQLSAARAALKNYIQTLNQSYGEPTPKTNYL